MTATQGFVGIGTQLLRGDGASPEQFGLIAECKDITMGGKSVEFVDMTHQESDGEYREYKPTFKNSGDLNVKYNYIGSNASQDALEDDFENKTLRNFKIVAPNSESSTWAFAAYVMNVGVSFPLNGPVEANITLRITGPITKTP